MIFERWRKRRQANKEMSRLFFEINQCKDSVKRQFLFIQLEIILKDKLKTLIRIETGEDIEELLGG